MALSWRRDWLYVQISLAVRHKMVGLLVFEDTDLPRRRHKYKRCSSHPPRAVLELNHDGSDPMSPAFPASGLFLSFSLSLSFRFTGLF